MQPVRIVLSTTHFKSVPEPQTEHQMSLGGRWPKWTPCSPGDPGTHSNLLIVMFANAVVQVQLRNRGRKSNQTNSWNQPYNKRISFVLSTKSDRPSRLRISPSTRSGPTILERQEYKLLYACFGSQSLHWNYQAHFFL